jgi:hypothetical protein
MYLQHRIHYTIIFTCICNTVYNILLYSRVSATPYTLYYYINMYLQHRINYIIIFTCICNTVYNILLYSHVSATPYTLYYYIHMYLQRRIHFCAAHLPTLCIYAFFVNESLSEDGVFSRNM